MHQFLLFNLQISREEIILVRGERLNDVASLSTNIQIMDEFISHIIWSGFHLEHVRTIFMGGVDIPGAHSYLKSEILHSSLEYRVCVHFERVVRDIWCRCCRDHTTVVRCWFESNYK